jgi:hypothetical protein
MRTDGCLKGVARRAYHRINKKPQNHRLHILVNHIETGSTVIALYHKRENEAEPDFRKAERHVLRT